MELVLSRKNGGFIDVWPFSPEWAVYVCKGDGRYGLLRGKKYLKMQTKAIERREEKLMETPKTPPPAASVQQASK
jgi:hypothetical protein